MAGLKKKIALSAALVGVAIGTGWTADAGVELLDKVTDWTTETRNFPRQVAHWATSWSWKPDADKPLAWFLGGLGVLLSSVWSLFNLRHGIIIAKAEHRKGPSFRGHHTLIMGLSARNPKLPHHELDMCFRKARLQDLSLPKADLARIVGTSDDDTVLPEVKMSHECLRTLFPLRDGDPQPHPWQQNLRMLWCHLKQGAEKDCVSLERVYVLPSRGEHPNDESEFKAGSQKGKDQFKQLLLTKIEDGAKELGITPPLGPENVIIEDSVNYEDLNETAAAIVRIVENARKARQTSRWEGGSAHGGICVDVTSGTKQFSIAAALVTMNKDLVFGYIDNDGLPHFYDANIEVAGRFGE